MSTAAFWLAIGGVVLSVLSLGWQAVTYFLSGPRVTVKMMEGARGAVGLLTMNVGTKASNWAQAASQGYDERVLVAQVTNTGRLATSVDRCAAEVEDNMSYMPLDPLNPPFGERLEAHATKTWCVSLAQIEVGIASAHEVLDQPAAQRVWMSVTLPGGKVVKSKESMLVGTSSG